MIIPRKVFISFLGTNNYLQTRYVFNGQKSSAVRFVQQALIGFLCKDWTKEDSVMIFYTQDSHDRNWVDGGQGAKVSEVEKIGLHSALKVMAFPMKIEAYQIADGFSEDDIWLIFNSVYERLKENDLIYFDVTHAFRSIPLFSTVLFNFARFMKNTRLVSIYYGAFEKLGPAFKVKEDIPDPNDRQAPIVDLTSLVELQNTNVATSNFIEFGKVGTIAEQLDAGLPPSTNAQRKTADAIKCLKRELANLDDYIGTCRMDNIRQGKYIKSIMGCFRAVMESSALRTSEKLLLLKIKENLNSFKGEETEDNITAAIQWAFCYGMLQQAYTLAQEFVIMKFCNLLRKENICSILVSDYKNNGKVLRDFGGGLLSISDEKIKKKEYKDELAKHEEIMSELLKENWIKKLRASYNVLRTNRNILNHAKSEDKNTAKMRLEFDDAYNKCIDILKIQETFLG